MPRPTFAQIIEKLEALMAEYERNPDLLDVSLQGMFSPAILRNLIAQIKQHPEIEAAENGVVLRFKVPKGAKGGLGILEEQERTWHVVWNGDDLLIVPAVQSKTITGDKIQVSRPFGTEKRKVAGTVGINVRADSPTPHFMPMAISIESHGPGSRRDDNAITSTKKRIAAIEARLAAKHPGVVLPTFTHISNDAGWLNIRYFQPYAKNDLFDALIGFDMRQKLLVAYGATRSIQACAQEGIVHHDIKQENFLCDVVNGNPLVYLADFGFANDVGKDSLAMVGTPSYTAPEIYLAYAISRQTSTNQQALESLLTLRETESAQMGLMLGLDYAIMQLIQKVADGHGEQTAARPEDDKDGATDRFALGFMLFEMFVGQDRTNQIATAMGGVIDDIMYQLLEDEDRRRTIDCNTEIQTLVGIIAAELLDVANAERDRDPKTADAINELIPIIQSLLSPDPNARMSMDYVMQQVTQILTTTAELGPNIQQIQQRQQQQAAALQIPQQGPITALVAKAKTTNEWAEDFREYVEDIKAGDLFSFARGVLGRDVADVFFTTIDTKVDWLLAEDPNTIEILQGIKASNGKQGDWLNIIKAYKANCEQILQQLDLLRDTVRTKNQKYPEDVLAAEQQLRVAIKLFIAICDEAGKRPGSKADSFKEVEAQASELERAIFAMALGGYTNRFGMRTGY